MSFFSFTKSENRRIEQVLPGGGVGAVTSGRVEEGGKGHGMVQYCVHIDVNGKMIPVETIPGIEGEGDK
jgi:hypothetical protein